MASTVQPDLDADGLLLRPWRADDHPAVRAAFADPAVQRWHCRTMDDDEACEWIGGWAEAWRAETDASWAVVDGDRVVGQVGLRRIRLADGVAAASYWVLPDARGRRIALRVLRGLTTWVFELGLHRLEVHHSVANLASCRVAGAAGFPLEGIMRGEGLHADGWHDMHLHARLATDPA